MLADDEIAHADVLKAGRHGSRTSSAAEFLDAASPEFAVIAAGYANRRGHPNRDVVERLMDRHSGVYRTGEDGLITIHADANRIAAERGAGALGLYFAFGSILMLPGR